MILKKYGESPVIELCHQLGEGVVHNCLGYTLQTSCCLKCINEIGLRSKIIFRDDDFTNVNQNYTKFLLCYLKSSEAAPYGVLFTTNAG